MFALRQKEKDEKDHVMQLFIKLLMNSFNGEQIRENIEEKIACKSEAGMMTMMNELLNMMNELLNIGKYRVLIILLKWLMMLVWKMKSKN